MFQTRSCGAHSSLCRTLRYPELLICSIVSEGGKRHIDLFIRLCLQNSGVLSDAKRKSMFDNLSDDEVTRMRAAVRQTD